jgi:hypothetical protein
MPIKMAFPSPNFFPMLGANNEKRAKVIRLRVVKNPAAPLEIPRSSRINGISGPTEAIEVRRLIEIKITPRISKVWEEDLGKGGLKYEGRDTKDEIRETRYKKQEIRLGPAVIKILE